MALDGQGSGKRVINPVVPAVMAESLAVEQERYIHVDYAVVGRRHGP